MNGKYVEFKPTLKVTVLIFIRLPLFCGQFIEYCIIFISIKYYFCLSIDEQIEIHMVT